MRLKVLVVHGLCLVRNMFTWTPKPIILMRLCLAGNIIVWTPKPVIRHAPVVYGLRLVRNIRVDPEACNSLAFVLSGTHSMDSEAYHSIAFALSGKHLVMDPEACNSSYT